MSLLTQAEAAERLRCSVKTIARLREAGELAYLPGRPVMIRQDDLNSYIERKLVCREKTRDRSSSLTRKAIMKSIGQKTEDRAAAALARKIIRSRKKS